MKILKPVLKPIEKVLAKPFQALLRLIEKPAAKLLALADAAAGALDKAKSLQEQSSKLKDMATALVVPASLDELK